MVTMFCSRPFTTLHVLDGCCATCCPHWLDPSAVVFGNRTDPWGGWNSEDVDVAVRGEDHVGACASAERVPSVAADSV